MNRLCVISTPQNFIQTTNFQTMSDIGIVGLILLIANGLISYYGFKNRVFLEAYKFQVYPILAHRDYKRLVLSLIHISEPTRP